MLKKQYIFKPLASKKLFKIIKNLQKHNGKKRKENQIQQNPRQESL